MIRYNTDGSLDTTFGTGGFVKTDLNSTLDIINALAVQSDGKIVVAGSSVQSGTGNDFALARYNPDGTLDTSFGVGGKVTTSFTTSNDMAYDVALQSDGKIVVAGLAAVNGDDFALARYNTNGTLDATFGTGGKVTTSFSTSADRAYGVAIQSDGKILAAGEAYNGSYYADFGVARYTVGGVLDTTFNVTGKVTTNWGSLYASDIARDVMIQVVNGAEKIVVAGYSSQGTTNGNDFALVRYNLNGTLDGSFGTGGKVTTDFGSVSGSTCDDRAYNIAVQADGTIVAAGASARSGSASKSDFALVRYQSNGALDTSFDSDGKVVTDFGNTADEAWTTTIQADGKIVAVGRSQQASSSWDVALARYQTNGSLDTSFGYDGEVTTDVGRPGSDDRGWGMAAALQGDGKIVVVGQTYFSNSGYNYDFGVARYNVDGSPDVSFGSAGNVVTDFSSSEEYARDVAIQADGKIVVAGYSYRSGTGYDFALVRYNVDGTLDSSFGTAGKVTTPIGSSTAADHAYGVAIQADGKIVVVGDSQQSSTYYDFALVRYNADGSLDTSFGSGGKVTTPFSSSWDTAYDVAIPSDGKIVVAGYSYQGANSYDFALARYDAYGNLDTTWDTDWAASPTASYTFADNWSGSVRVEVTNGAQTATDTASVTVLNVAPTAEAGGPYAVDEGSSVPLTLAGSGSDPAGPNDPLLFEWDFDGDDQFDDATGQNPTFDASMLDGPATVTVTLRVSDDDGASSVDTATIVVNNLAPTADAGGPYEMDEGGLLALAGSGADPGSGSDPLVFEWDFDGDGRFGEAGVAAERGDEVGPQARFSAEKLDGPTTVTVALRVTDRGGLSDESTAQIHVTNVAPVVTSVQLLPHQMEEAGWEFLVVAFADPGSMDGHLVRIQWGDGSADTVWWLGAGIMRQGFYHYYADDPAGVTPDVYPIHVTVTDDEGAAAESGQLAIQERTVFEFESDLYFNDGNVHYFDSLHKGGYTIWMPSGEDFQVFGRWHTNYLGTPMPAVGKPGETVMLARDDGQAFSLKYLYLWEYGRNPTQPMRLTFTGTRVDGSTLIQTLESTNRRPFDFLGFTDVVSVSWRASTETGYAPLFMFDDLVVETHTTQTEDPEMSVLNVAPRITGLAVEPSNVDENGTVTLAGTFVDPGTADTHRVLVDWGDGSAPTTIDLLQGERSISAAHQYLDDGSYTIGVTVSDDDGGSDSSGQPVTVTTTVLDFAEWTHDSVYCEAFYTFQRYSNAEYSVDLGGRALRALGRFDPGYPGATALYCNGYAPVVLTRDDGGLFTLESMDISELGAVPRFLPAYVTFTGYRADGSTVIKNVTTDGVFGLERIEFEDFTDLLSVSFQGNNPEGDQGFLYQFTNIALEGRSNPVASPAVTVANVAPVIASLTNDATFDAPGAEGQPVQVTASFADVGTLDTHQATIDWGDGTPPEAATVVETGGAGSVAASHAYTQGGVYRVTLTLTDDDTGAAAEQTTAVVVGAAVHDGVLQVVGTPSADVVSINDTGTGLIEVHGSFFPEAALRTFPVAGIDRIRVWLGAGDDQFSIAGSVYLAAILGGGDGNDHMTAGGGPTVFLGESGDDTLIGGTNRDILIGGSGADRLVGTREDDILIGGTTRYDANDAALLALLAEWTSDRLFHARIGNIRDGTGPILGETGIKLVKGVTVFSDGALDQLTGSSGEDWFLYDPSEDRATDEKTGEAIG